MNKVLKMFLVAVTGTIGICVIIWLLSTTSANMQQASARGETFGILIGVVVFASIGLALFNYFQRK